MGRVPISLENFDFLVASTYKWLLGAHGLGVIYLSARLEESLKPSAADWYGISDIFASDRFERYSYKAGRRPAGLRDAQFRFQLLLAAKSGLSA
jgi:selenocysteine lyase/cysteine desulfurase